MEDFPLYCKILTMSRKSTGSERFLMRELSLISCGQTLTLTLMALRSLQEEQASNSAEMW